MAVSVEECVSVGEESLGGQGERGLVGQDRNPVLWLLWNLLLHLVTLGPHL